MFEVRGKQATISGLLGLLGTAAGLELSVADGQVAIGAQTGPARSGRLRECLREIVGAVPRTARVDVDTVNLAFGWFGEWQKLNAINAVGFEAEAPGMGPVIAIHEIWENYRGWTASGLTPYGPAHAAALAVEREVAQELTGRQGGQVAAVRFDVDTADGYVLDYESYFVVFTPKPKEQWATGRLAAAFHARQPLRSVVLPDLPAGQRVSGDRVADVVSLLEGQPRATAKITGQRTAEETAEVSGQRAAAVRNAVSVALKEDKYASGSGVDVGYDLAKGAGSDLGSRRAWASPRDEVAADPGVRIEISAPA